MRRTFGAAPRLTGALRALLTTLLLAIGVLAFGGTAVAQEEGTSEGTSEEEATGTEVRGTLRARDEAGEDIFLEGVQFIVSDADGNEVGTGVTDAEGNWFVPLPGAGEYSTLLVEETLPEGNSLRNPENNPLTFTVNEGDSRPNLFPLGEARASSDNTIKALQLAVDGLKLGLIIAMCAIGLSLIYGTTSLVNFAHGEMVTFGAMTAYLFHVTGVFGWESSLILAALFTIVLSGMAGGLFNAGVWRPLRNKGASLISALVVSIGFSIFLRYIMLYIFGGRDGFYRDYRIQEKWDLGWFTLAPKDAVIMVLSTIILVGVGIALQTTRAGKAMRAVADNRDLAESSGIDVEKVISWVWVSGSALAGLGGVLFATTEAIGWEMGFRILLLMFAGVTLGGLGTAYGALFGSLIIGVFIQTSTLVIPSDLKNVGALLMLVVVLLVRPQGLLGRAERIG
ncbi:MAG: branched-chain amino acid ABC transporter permease [Ilumatobacter sp.]|nr:branched-chain amino acid ABC transporter permease [Ilumatobacter sp.]